MALIRPGAWVGRDRWHVLGWTLRHEQLLDFIVELEPLSYRQPTVNADIEFYSGSMGLKWIDCLFNASERRSQRCSSGSSTQKSVFVVVDLLLHLHSEAHGMSGSFPSSDLACGT